MVESGRSTFYLGSYGVKLMPFDSRPNSDFLPFPFQAAVASGAFVPTEALGAAVGAQSERDTARLKAMPHTSKARAATYPRKSAAVQTAKQANNPAGIFGQCRTL